MFDPTAQIGQRSALSDEIVYHDIAAPFTDTALESGLARKATVSVRTRVTDDIRLYDRSLESNAQFIAEKCRQRDRNCIDAAALVGMSADKYRCASLIDWADQRSHCCDTRFIDQGADQPCRSLCVPRFRDGIFRMPLRIGFGG